ncbi:MAG: DUF4012 domain-containing protein [Candidatus Gracilibacteria bacterium]
MNQQFTATKIKPIVLKVLRILLYILIAFIAWVIVSMHTLVRFFPHTFQLSGFPFSKTYLVLLQNNAELRPGGGFVAAYGELHIQNGLFPSFFIKDVFTLKGYNDDKIQEPPYPMGDLLQNKYYKGYSFHDSNWIPDLKTSAKTTLEFYKEEFPNKNIDGIIAVNFSVVEDLLGIIGPINVNGKSISKDNLFHTIQYEQNNIDLHDIAQLQNRKSILSIIAPAFTKKLITSLPKYPQIFTLLGNDLDSKDISLYFTDENLEKSFQKYKWTADFPVSENKRDIFGVVEANLGGMKSDRYISRSFEYFVNLKKSTDITSKLQPEAKVRLVFRHSGDYNPPLSHVYKGYVRIYAPKGSTLLPGYSSDIEPYQELGYTVFGKKLEIEPKTTSVIEFAYSLPQDVISDNTYNLHIFKQSGVENTTYTASVSTPVDHIITSQDFRTAENSAYFTGSLKTDQDLHLKFTNDSTPPRITNQEFIDVNRIILQFNEPILESDCLNIENYTVLDTDSVVVEASSRPKVRFIKCENRQLTIYTQNITKQPNEKFTVELTNIRDLSNNILTPNPMKITVIQRLGEDK